MAKYTATIRELYMSGYDFGLQQYPIYNEEVRERINNKIINHYYSHEIGFETPQEFIFFLNMRMDEIMPYYNELLKSELLEVDPTLSFKRQFSRNIVETSSKETTSITESEASVSTENENNSNTEKDFSRESQSNENGINKKNNSGKNVEQKTPMSMLNSVAIENDDYASLITKNNGKNEEEMTQNSLAKEGVKDNTKTDITDTSVSDSENTISNEGEESQNRAFEEVVMQEGREIPLSDLLIKYRETFLNIDLMIINELKDLFMMVY